jgi:transaldolase
MVNRIIDDLRVKLFCDGADISTILEMSRNPWIKGFTTNPTLMRKAGIVDFEDFTRRIARVVPNHPVSVEVFADELDGMRSQARTIASWGANINVKLPVTNTRGEFTGRLIRELSAEGIMLNITAVMTLEQVRRIAQELDPETHAIVSVFAGRIADTGVDPVPLMAKALEILKSHSRAQLLWASPRELLNVFQADAIGCHIITATPDILNKLSLTGKDLEGYSLETVRMFFDDARAAGYSIAEPPSIALEALDPERASDGALIAS